MALGVILKSILNFMVKAESKVTLMGNSKDAKSDNDVLTRGRKCARTHEEIVQKVQSSRMKEGMEGNGGKGKGQKKG